MRFLTRRLIHVGRHQLSPTRRDIPRKPRLPLASSSSISTASISTTPQPDIHPLTRGTGLVFPEKYIPPTRRTSPLCIFHYYRTPNATNRWSHRTPDQQRQVLIFTDGSCNVSDRRAGWAFTTGPAPGNGPEACPHTISGRLENSGPFGDAAEQTCNRAELRAVLAALRFRSWADEGFKTVMIATDSRLAVQGLTTWARDWVVNGWKGSDRKPVKNRDLWEAVLGEVERMHRVDGVATQFWDITRKSNHVADAAAKEAAKGVDLDEYTDVLAKHYETGQRKAPESVMPSG